MSRLSIGTDALLTLPSQLPSLVPVHQLSASLRCYFAFKINKSISLSDLPSASSCP